MDIATTVTLVNSLTNACVVRSDDKIKVVDYELDTATEFCVVPLEGLEFPKEGEDFYLSTIDRQFYLESVKCIDLGEGKFGYKIGLMPRPSQTWRWQPTNKYPNGKPLTFTPVSLTCGGAFQSHRSLFILRKGDTKQILMSEQSNGCQIRMRGGHA